MSAEADAVIELDALLALGSSLGERLDADACARIAALAQLVPGRLRRVVAALGRQRCGAAVDALLQLPRGTRGVVESVFAAVCRGVVRPRPDGGGFPHMLALEFRSSASRRFPQLVARASAAFGRDLERIRVADKLHYRVALIGEPVDLSARAPAYELDIEALHRDLVRLRGVCLWLNGWRFDDDAALSPAARTPLLRGWFEWARANDHAAKTATDST